MVLLSELTTQMSMFPATKPAGYATASAVVAPLAWMPVATTAAVRGPAPGAAPATLRAILPRLDSLTGLRFFAAYFVLMNSDASHDGRPDETVVKLKADSKRNP